MGRNEGDLDAIKRLWPQILSRKDQDLARCRDWVADAPDGQIAGIWLAIQDGAEVRALDDDSLVVLRTMALVGLCAAIESVITAED